ncbi:MAG: PilZ domain-containing protein [Lachnospira sp.]
MNNSIEKRRHKRINADLKLNVSSLFNQNNVKIVNIDSPITVINVSKSGIGFESKSILPLDFYFNAALKLGSEEDVLYCVVRIIRCLPIEETDMYSYGCEFVGMAPVLDYIFERFAAEQEA